MNPWSSTSAYPGGMPYTSGYSSSPMSPDAILGNDSLNNNSYQSDDSSRQYLNKDGYQKKEGYKPEKTSWSAYPSRARYQRSAYRGDNKRPYRKLNGLWIGENGEMLGIRGNRFLWYDDDNQYAKGELASSPTMMKARVEGASTVVRYHYRLQANELVIMSRDGKSHTFNRMPLIQLPNVSAKPRTAYSNYKPASDHAHVSYSSYGSGLKSDKGSLYSRKQFERTSPSHDKNRRSRSVAQRGYYPVERSATRSPRVPYARHGARKVLPSVARFADPVRQLPTGNASINDTGYDGDKRQQLTSKSPADIRSSLPTTTIPMFQQYLPAAGKPISSSEVDSDALPAEVMNEHSSIWNSSTAGLDMSDPNTYLYSYLKDNDNMPGSASSRSGDSSAQVNPASAGQGDSDRSTGAAKRLGSNIWKPNHSFPDRRQIPAQAESALTANSELRQFAWPKTGSWD